MTNGPTGLIRNSQQSLASPHPAVSHGPGFSPQSPHHQQAPQEQVSHTPPCGGRGDPLELKQEEIGSIPRPTRIFAKNLQTEMKLDVSDDASAYYLKIRVSGLIGIPHSVTQCSSFEQSVIRGYMSEDYWMNWSKVPDNLKNNFFKKVSFFNATRTQPPVSHRTHQQTSVLLI